MRILKNAAFALLLLDALTSVPGAAQQKTFAAPANMRLHAVTVASVDILDPNATTWNQVPARTIGLNRTPPLYDTEAPAENEIPVLEVRIARAPGRLLVHLSWRDLAENSSTLQAPPTTPYETRNRKEQTEATDRFFDAAAVMYPTRRDASVQSPSLQMGDQRDPVTIYYWNAARGAMLMEAQGRGTTRRTDTSFPAQASYRAGVWRVVLVLPEQSAGTPLAFAVWNGSQLDRDGRKYFSTWHWLE